MLKRITLRMPHRHIARDFEDKFGRPISPVTVARLRKRHLLAITSAQSQIVESAAIDAAALKQQSYRLLERKMGNAEDDATELDKLRSQFQRGDIDEEVYKAKRKLYSELTVTELTNIANATFSHTKGQEAPPPSATDVAAMQSLVEGIKSGNPVALIQVLNQTITSVGENPGA